MADPLAADPSALARDLAAFFTSGEVSDETAFDALARRVFAHQYTGNRPYRAFCDARGTSPQTIAAWRDIPAAPAAAFKHFALTCAPEGTCRSENGGRTFHSSGTTGAETSRHFMDATALNLYRVSLRAGYRRFVLPDAARLPVFALMAPPAPQVWGEEKSVSPGPGFTPGPAFARLSSPQTWGAGGAGGAAAPHSSLSFMLAELIADDGGRFFSAPGWQDELAAALRALAAPAVIFGTAFAFVHFFDAAAAETFALPAGSRVVETGGFKGRSREVGRDELYALFTQRLGVPATHCLSEYGMSEMASQFYDSTLVDWVGSVVRPARKIGPFWLRTRVVDPVTGMDAAPGEPGLLAHYDLANLNSVFAIQTEDYGHAAPDNHGFVLLGRAPGAVLRGCSLLAEEMAAAAITPQENPPQPPNQTS